MNIKYKLRIDYMVYSVYWRIISWRQLENTVSKMRGKM